MKTKKKIFIGLCCALLGLTIWSQIYTWKVDKAVNHLNSSALPRSHTCCAWFVMRAMQEGGCPMVILPAFAYSKILPFYGFKEVETENYEKGDIIVFPAVKHHIWGHIAMWNGTQWVSDFKQKSKFVATGYISTKYRVFRHEP